MNPIDEKKRRLRRERRVAERRTAVEAAEIADEPLNSRCPQSPAPQRQTETPMTTLAEAFSAAETPPTQETDFPGEKPLSARQVRTLKRNEAREKMERCACMELCELMNAAEAGDAAAQFVLAEQYAANGYEDESIVPLLRSAAEQDFPPALGLYGSQLACEGETERGEEMIRQAAAIGFGEGAYQYAQTLLQQKKPRAAARWLELAARASYIPAYKTLAAVCHSLSWRDDEAAWLKKAADAGDAESAYRYASMLGGYRPPKGSESAMVRYYLFAMRNGYPRAVFPLAKFHRRYIKRFVCMAYYFEKGFQRVEDPIYKTIIGDCERAVAAYLEAADLAPELRDEILADIMVECDDAWKTEHRLKALQGLADRGHAPSAAELAYLRQRGDI